MASFKTNGFLSASAPLRRAKCSIFPILSILCILAIISSVNIYLMINIAMLENRHQSSTTNERLASGRSLTIHTQPELGLGPQLVTQQSMTQQQQQTLPIRSSSWATSPHLADCRKVVAESMAEEPGMFMPITIGVRSTHTKFFYMNIHNPLIDTVSYKIFKEGCFECDHLAKLLDALSSYPDSSLVDIGANIGMWTLVAASANHETFSMEPFADNYKRICNSVMKNSFYDKVHVFNVAATSSSTTFRIDVPNRNKGGGRVEEVVQQSEEAVVQNNKETIDHDDQYIVKGVPIDSLHIPTDRPIVLKLDVEGHELQALLGGMDFLRRADIVYAMTELRPTFQTDDKTFSAWKDIMSILSSKNLQPYRIDYGNETKLDVHRLHQWKHVKHPAVRYFDVVWRKEG